MPTSKIQQERIKRLLKLVEENPERDIIPMVDGELCGGEYSYYLGEWRNPELDEVYTENERIYFRFEDEEELENIYFDRLWDEVYGSKLRLTDEEEKELEKLVKEKIEGLPWEKVIVVKITQP